MNSSNRLKINTIRNAPLIPVFFHKDKNMASEVMLTCYEAGLRVFEFTDRGEEAGEVFSHLHKIRIDECPDLLLGMGSVVSGEKAIKYTDDGADFIVSPVMLPDMGKICVKNNILWIPGCGSVTEVYQASLVGAEIIKVFPAKVLGKDFIKSVLQIFPTLNLMPTGGVLPEKNDIEQWYFAGAITVGVGSALFGNLVTLLANRQEAIEKIKILISELAFYKVKK